MHVNKNSNHLLQTTDAQVWAKEFMDIFGEKLDTIDEGLMITWFANSIMTGYDHRGDELRERIEHLERRLRIRGTKVGKVLDDDHLRAENQKLRELLLLTDPSVSNVTVGETQTRQWQEFTKWMESHGEEV
jgi:hypothetical protein